MSHDVTGKGRDSLVAQRTMVLQMTPSKGLLKGPVARVVGGVPADGVPADGVPADGVPADGVPADGVPGGGVPGDGVPDGVPADGVPDGVPGEDGYVIKDGFVWDWEGSPRASPYTNIIGYRIAVITPMRWIRLTKQIV